MLRHWSQLVPNMSTDIRGHKALRHHHHHHRDASIDNSRRRVPGISPGEGDHKKLLLNKSSLGLCTYNFQVII